MPQKSSRQGRKKSGAHARRAGESLRQRIKSVESGAASARQVAGRAEKLSAGIYQAAHAIEQRAHAVHERVESVEARVHEVKKKPQEAATKERPFIIVGIGASAGGYEAYAQLLENLPTDTGMAFVLVQHLDPVHESKLSELLARATKMPVVEIKNQTVVEPNHIYVIP